MATTIESHDLKLSDVRVELDSDGVIWIWVAGGAGIYRVEQWKEIVSFVSAQVTLITEREDY